MFHIFHLFLLISLTHSQSIDPKSPNDQICISGSVDDDVNGIFYYSSWDSDTNGSIYYNSETNRYLYPWANESTKYYFVSSDTQRVTGSHCRLPITNDTILNPSDCFNDYLEQWKSFNGTQFVSDKDLRLVNCNDICVSGNDHSVFDGTYKWLDFNRTIRASLYQCTDCYSYTSSDVYLYGWIYSSGRYDWKIGPDYTTSSAWNLCILGYIEEEDYKFNLEDCISWKTYTNGSFKVDEGLTVERCVRDPTASLTASPTQFPFPISYPSILFGFETASKDQSSLATTDNIVTVTLYWETSVFQCDVFPTEYTTYYGCDTSNNRTTVTVPPPVPHGIQFDNEGWDEVVINKILIQHQQSEYSNKTTYQMVRFCKDTSCEDAISDTFIVGSVCTGKNQSMLVAFNVNDTTQPGIIEYTQFVSDKVLILMTCDNICVSGNDIDGLDGTYEWLHFNRTTRASVYKCTNCVRAAYLSGWITSYGEYIWIIGSDYTALAAWSYCSLGYIQEEEYIFDLEDCNTWRTLDDSYSYWTFDRDLMAQKCTPQPTSHPSYGYPAAAPTWSPFTISYPSILFGFETASKTQSLLATTEYTVTITLYWETSMYQCPVFPTDYATYYGCDTSSRRTTIHEWDPEDVPYGIQFDNEGWDEVIIDKVIVQHQESEYSNNNIYEMINFCKNTSCEDDISDTFVVGSLCTENNQSMLVVFDVNNTTQAGIIAHTQDVSAKDLQLVTCDDICVSGRDSYVDGTYKWLHFDRTIRASVYQCADCCHYNRYGLQPSFLYGWIYSEPFGIRYWKIGTDYTYSSSLTHCYIASSSSQEEMYIFNLEDCRSWQIYDSKNGGWTDEEGLTVQECTPQPTIQESLPPTPTCFQYTEFYGGLDGSVLDVWNQNKVIGISSWGIFVGMGYSYNKAIGNIGWISNDTLDNARNPVGEAPTSNVISCASFILDIGDYIHGYRVIHTVFVYGLYFYTVNNRSYHCVHQDINVTEYNDSGIVLFERHYLSGFIFRFSEIIDAIAFVFKDIDADCTSSPFASSYPSFLFGFETASKNQSSLATTEHTVTITLHWETSVFQCHVFPTEYDTYYGCDTSDNQTTRQCDSEIILPPVPHGIQIDNEEWDEVIINKVIIQHQQSAYSNSIIYEMLNFCSDPPCNTSSIWNTLTVASSCTRENQSVVVILDINDTTQPASIEYIEWTEDYFEFQCIPIAHCSDAIITPSYGSLTHYRRHIDVNQGRINAITSWALKVSDNTDIALANMRWSSDQQTSFNEYGYASRLNKCTNFSLDDNDYINGYRVVHNNYTIRGLTFYAKKGGLYHCISNDQPDGQDDSGDVVFPDRYLSGFYVSSYEVINSIAFQFTHVNNTNICYNVTNTSTPTMEPTTEPTFNPSTDPTHIPTRTPLHTDDIIIITHDDISTNWIAFNITNLNLSC
eukprot:109964_1